MYRYEIIMNNMGYKHQCENVIFEGKDGLFYVNKKKDGYHQISYCPKQYFDRWAICRHINFTLMVKNDSWSQDDVEKRFIQDIKDCEMLGKLIPARFFDRFINIEL